MGLGKLRHALKRGMGGSRCGKGRSEKTEIMKAYSDRLRRKEAKDVIGEQLEELEELEDYEDYEEFND